MSFEERLMAATRRVNQLAGSTIFDGPLGPEPDEPWHYTYMPIKQTEDNEDKTK